VDDDDGNDDDDCVIDYFGFLLELSQKLEDRSMLV
jgi:hypothetical protein